MAIFKCKMCGGDLEASSVDTVFECEYCGTTQTIPTSRDEDVTNLFNRAELLRRKCDFDKAEGVYERILEIDPSEAEAYWGVILCKFGIEYVTDPATTKKIPTCHRTSYDAIVADEYYIEALKHADVVQKSIYEKEAKQIDQIQKGILALSAKEEPYDVFICYKETDPSGKRTKDSVLASEIYHQLIQEGFRVFYAAITLEDKLGEEYEPYIFSALNSSKVMLVVGTKPEYFNAVWVKNEWSRFLKIVKKDRTKKIIPCYRDMDAYDLPDEFAHLQAQDMSKLGFVSDLVRGIKKIISAGAPVKQETPVSMLRGVSSVDSFDSAKGDGALLNYLKRARVLVEEGDFYGAETWANKCLDLDFECAEAYLVKLMAQYKACTVEGLARAESSFIDNVNYKRAARFGSPELSAHLVDIARKRDYNLAKDMYFDAQTVSDYQGIRELLLPLGDYNVSLEFINMCVDNIRYIITMELREETDKRLFATAIAPIAEAACRWADQKIAVENASVTCDRSKFKNAALTLGFSIAAFVFLIIAIANGGGTLPVLLFVVPLIITVVLFFVFAKKYFQKYFAILIVVAFFTAGYFLFSVPFIMAYQTVKSRELVERLTAEEEKLQICEDNLNATATAIDDRATVERIKHLALSGYEPTEIAHKVSEEEIDYI